MTSWIASNYDPRTAHPWGKPSQEEYPRRPERCSIDGADVSFYGLQASSVPFRHSGMCQVVSSSEMSRLGLVVFRAAAKAAEEKRFSGQYTIAEVGHAGEKGYWNIEAPRVGVEGAREPKEVEAA